MNDFSSFNISIHSAFCISFSYKGSFSINNSSQFCFFNSAFSFGVINISSSCSIILSGWLISNKFISSFFSIVIFSSLFFPSNNILLIFSFFISCCFLIPFNSIFSSGLIILFSISNFLFNEIFIWSLYSILFSCISNPSIKILSVFILTKESFSFSFGGI